MLSILIPRSELDSTSLIFLNSEALTHPSPTNGGKVADYNYDLLSGKLSFYDINGVKPLKYTF